jgi:hypothetical protein
MYEYHIFKKFDYSTPVAGESDCDIISNKDCCHTSHINIGDHVILYDIVSLYCLDNLEKCFLNCVATALRMLKIFLGV